METDLKEHKSQKLELHPISLREANEFVKKFHRHHKRARGHKFSLAVCKGDKIVGVAIVGRPVARHRDDGYTLEISRLCTDGTRNACSFLYGASRKAAFAMGYRKIGTYTLPEEGGVSLVASGWRLIGETKGGSWNTPSRPRIDKAPLGKKWLWEAEK